MGSTTKKRVLIATPVLLLGGTEIQILSLVQVLVGAGYLVMVCCYYEYDESVVAQFEKTGAEVTLLGLNRSNGKFGVPKIWELIRKFVVVLKKYHPDIVHVQYLAPGLVPIIAAKLGGIQTVFATVHIAGSIVYGLKAKMLLRFAALLCKGFFCVSRGVEEFWFGDSEIFSAATIKRKRKHFTIHNSIDVSRINQILNGVDHEKSRRDFGTEGKKVVGIVGRLAPQKGHTFLLDAMVEILERDTNVILIVVGDGPERTSLQAKAQNLNIYQHILWLGARQQEEVFRLYSMMDVFVMPSLYEGFGLTAAEAMAVGLPVVGTRIEGLAEVIEDGLTGFLVPPADKHALTERIVHLLNNRDMAVAMGKKGAERVKNLFSLETFSERIINAYEYFHIKQDF
jgi:glycosyltransferase involved in cell wall biosynthesis